MTTPSATGDELIWVATQLLPELVLIVDAYRVDHKQRGFCSTCDPITDLEFIRVKNPDPTTEEVVDNGKCNAQMQIVQTNQYVIKIHRVAYVYPPITALVYRSEDGAIDVKDDNGMKLFAVRRDTDKAPIMDMEFVYGGDRFLHRFDNWACFQFFNHVWCMFRTGTNIVPFGFNESESGKSIYFSTAWHGWKDYCGRMKVEPARPIPSLGLTWRHKSNVPLTGFRVMTYDETMRSTLANFSQGMKINDFVYIRCEYGNGSPLVHAQFAPCMPTGSLRTLLDWTRVTPNLYLGTACDWSIFWKDGICICPAASINSTRMER